jgi:DNA-binding CsgD family transcriptional regulator
MSVPVAALDSPASSTRAAAMMRSVEHGWASQSDRRTVLQYIAQHKAEEDPLIALVMRRPQCLVTVARSAVVSESAWKMSPVRNEVHFPAGIDDSLVSARFADGVFTGFVLKRARGSRPFADRECDIVELFQSSGAWSAPVDRSRDTRPDAGGPSASTRLSDREREAMRLLSTGLSEKQIATELCLSPHTVHDYVKAVYRKFGVTSRAEFMARCALRAARAMPRESLVCDEGLGGPGRHPEPTTER